ncbi:MAG: CDP-alcohol phosphatidyltransferase family protein [Candidatus Micrarchaeota archaeon]|nr:CDP-alcohol phosphatidyltransferase family protein [Candidatus Micrarchaeota archaeon]
MIAEKLRDILNKSIFFPIGKKLSFLSPDFITSWAYPLCILAGYFIFIKDYPLALLFILLSSVVDNLDGAVAKANNKKTSFGSYFDAFTDRIQEFFILLGFALSGYAVEAFFAISASFMVSYAKARAEMIKPLGNMDWPSIGERAERLVIVMLFMLIAIFYPRFYDYSVIGIGLWVLTAVATIGTIQRFFFAKGILSK